MTGLHSLNGRNKFDTLKKTSEKHISNDEHENFVTVHIQAAAECIPNKPRGKYRVPWEWTTIKGKRESIKKASLL